MARVKILIVIPARFHSTRLPGKPLADLCGAPLVQHVWQRCCQAIGGESVVIATDDDRVASVATSFGATVDMTSTECLTGTDRVAEVAKQRKADWYVNVQGDEPFVDPGAIRTIINRAEVAETAISAINAMSSITVEEEFRSGTVPKPVTNLDGRLLFMSRAAIPTDKALSFRSAYRQVGLYAFRPSALHLYGPGAKKSPLEEIEDIEILRIVEAGLTVQMAEVPSSGIAVDTELDLARARDIFHSSSSPSPIGPGI